MANYALPPINDIMHRHVGGAEITPAEAGLASTPAYEPATLDYSKAPLETPAEEKKLDSLDEKSESVGHQVEIQDIDIKPYVRGDPLPEDPDQLPETVAQQMTFRAIFVGCCIGALVQASNIYLGLKTGLTFGPQLLGGIGGFLVLRPLSRAIPQSLPKWVGVGHFGPKENVACQSAATAAGGLGILFVSAFPAMYQLGLLSAKPQDDTGKLIGFLFTTAFYGMSFAIPFRKFYILKQKLTFPTPSATAFAIKALHNTKTGAADAARKGKWLFFSYLAAFIQKIASTWAPGILYDWHVFYWIADWGGKSAQVVDNWMWWFEWTPAFFGAGMLAGVNPSWSFYGGSVLAWGIIGPSLVATGRAVGKSAVQPGDDSGIPYTSYTSMSCKDPTGTNCSPRYNLLWPGVLIMLVASFVEIGMQYKAFARGLTPAVYGVRNYFRVRKGQPKLHHETMVESEDPAQPHEMVPNWLWISMTIIATILTMVILPVVFEVNAGITLLSIFLGFLFAAMGVLGAGTTDINPVTSCAKASQLIIGGATHNWYSDQVNPATGLNNKLLQTNLWAGLVGAGAAGQTGDMTGDLKTGHLLRAAPIAQYVAQACGAFCSIFLCVGFYILFTTAAPCINEIDPDTCPYLVPSAAAWRAVAIGVTAASLPVPITSGIIAIILSVAAAAIIIARETIVPVKYRPYVPNPVAVGMAFVLPATTYGLAMFIGSTAAWFWNRRNPTMFEAVGFACAAGLIAGEGLGGVVQAVIIIAGGADPSIVSTAGCPNGGC